MSKDEFAFLILLFTVYYITERCLRFALCVFHKTFYQKIRESRKDLVFFGIWMGLLISAISTPLCAHGARNARVLWFHSHGTGEWSLDPYSKGCLAARAILWTSELNRLDMYNIYVIHHTASIASLISFIYFEWPTLILFTIYTSLISEIPGDMLWMLSAYLEASEGPSPALMRFRYYLVRFNVLQYTFLRGAGIASVSWMLFTDSPGLQRRSLLEQTYAYISLALYTLYCTAYLIRQSRAIAASHSSFTPTITSGDQGAQKDAIQPSHLREWLKRGPAGTLELHFGQYPVIIFVPYGLFMGAGFASLVFVSLTFGALPGTSYDNLSLALNICLAFSVIFARMLSIIMEDGLPKLVSHPIATVFRPGFWLHGGLFGAAVGALLSDRLGYIENFGMFAGSLAVGLPLYETFSRIGCHTYGCCYGQPLQRNLTKSNHNFSSPILWSIFPYPAVTYNHATRYAATRLNPAILNQPLVPIQLISATLFLLSFLWISLPLTHIWGVEAAGSITLICHTIIRLITEPYRADFRGAMRWNFSTTGRLALFQMLCAIIWVAHTLTSEDETRTLKLNSELGAIVDRVRQSIFAAILGIVVYGLHVGEVGSWTGMKKK